MVHHGESDVTGYQLLNGDGVMGHVGYKAALCVLLFFAGCISSGSFTVTEHPGSRFDPQLTVYIVNKGADCLNVNDDLAHRMLKAGFNVSSDLPREIRPRPSDVYLETICRTAYIYRLDYEYSWRTTFLFNVKVIDRFDAELIDITSKVPIMELRFRGSRSVAGTLDELVERLSPLLQKK